MFVAEFLGVSNMMDGAVVGGDVTAAARSRRRLRAARAAAATSTARGPVKIVGAARAGDAAARTARPPENILPGMVERTVYVGANVQVIVRLATGVQLQAAITNTGRRPGWIRGRRSMVHIPADALRVLRDDTGPYIPVEPAASPEEPNPLRVVT